MKIWIDVSSPDVIFTRKEWPEGVPYPAVGDTVLLRINEVTWVFTVLTRTIGIGYDPVTQGPGANVVITVSSSPPPEFRW